MGTISRFNGARDLLIAGLTIVRSHYIMRP